MIEVILAWGAVQVLSVGSLLIVVDGDGRLIEIGLVIDKRVRRVSASDMQRIIDNGTRRQEIPEDDSYHGKRVTNLHHASGCVQ